MRGYILTGLLLLIFSISQTEATGGKNESESKGGLKKKDADHKEFPKECRHLLKKKKDGRHHTYEEINLCLKKFDLFESDIKLTEEQRAYLEKTLKKGGNKHNIRKRGASKSSGKWTQYRDSNGNKILPYTIDKAVNSYARDAIKYVAKTFKQYTCIRLQPRTKERTYLKFIVDDGCWSYVGRVEDVGPQEISIDEGCGYNDTVIHETLHALGFWHEQSRPDRDDYIFIDFKNIEDGLEDNFEKYPKHRFDSLDSPYDIKSIMHYDAYAFSKNKKPTILNRETMKPIATPEVITKEDIYQLNRLYDCPHADKTCANLPEIFGNGNIKEEAQETFKLAEEVNLECGEGYLPSGSTVAKCENDGFIPSTFKCVKQECKDVYPRDCPRWVYLGYCKKTYVSYMEKNCKKSCGLCGETGDCNKLPRIVGKGGFEEDDESFNIGDQVHLNCAEEFEPSGAEVSTCETNGFKPATLTCKRVSCNILPKIVGNGGFEEEDHEYFEIGGQVHLNCADGFQPSGPAVSTCGANGFTPSKLICKKESCDKFPKIVGKGGFKEDHKSFGIGEQVNLNCDDEFESAGPTVSTCEQTGFNPDTLTCKRVSCNILPRIVGRGSFGEFYQESFELGDKVYLTCESGFEPSGATVSTCGSNGFAPSKLTCKKTCTNLPTIVGDGNIKEEDQETFELGDKVHLECGDGYSPSGPTVAVCRYNGFSPSTLICARDIKGCNDNYPNDCPRWATYGYCKKKYVSFMKTNCKKSCDLCQAAGDCNELPRIVGKGGFEEDQKSFNIGDQVHLNCAEEFEPSGAEVATCEANGFKPATLTCKRVHCNKFPRIVGKGGFEEDHRSFEIGDQVHLNCGDEFKPSGAEVATCESNGFKPATLTCKRAFCHLPPKISGEGELDIDKEMYEVGEKVYVECEAGYFLDGPDSAICGANGFKPSVFKCIQESTYCEDEFGSCGQWAKLNYCNIKYVRFMRQNCPRSCNRCSKKKCQDDRSAICIKHKERGYCTKEFLKNTMEYLCDQTCFCS